MTFPNSLAIHSSIILDVMFAGRARVSKEVTFTSQFAGSVTAMVPSGREVLGH